MISLKSQIGNNENMTREDPRAKLATATLVVVGSLLVLSAFLALSVSAATTASYGFNQNGNVLITDQFNNRVIEVNPLTKHIVWSFGSGNPNLLQSGSKRDHRVK